MPRSFLRLVNPIDNPDQMIDALVYNHNQLVAPEDEVIVVGDVCYQKAPDYLYHIKRFNGRKILIRGNHDRGITDDQFLEYFVKVIPDGGGMKKDICDIPCYITHYPTCGRVDMFNLVGHVHSIFKYQLNMFNVGVDVNHFKPVCLDTIPFHLKAITTFYDDDAWVAYNGINTFYRESRGKKGTYFRPISA